MEPLEVVGAPKDDVEDDSLRDPNRFRLEKPLESVNRSEKKVVVVTYSSGDPFGHLWPLQLPMCYEPSSTRLPFVTMHHVCTLVTYAVGLLTEFKK